MNQPLSFEPECEPDPGVAAARGTVETSEFYFGSHSMELMLGYDCTDSLAARIGAMTDHVVLIADEHVFGLWGDVLRSSLERFVAVSCIQCSATESGKSLDTVQAMLDQSVAAGATRRSVIVSFGGGLVGNLAGLAAGLLFRGVRLVHVPTTLLAMSDSVLSQKQAVNGRVAKNLYGLYHPAQLTCIDVQYLHTLPQPEFSAGVVELCKNGLAFDIDGLRQVEDLAVQADPAAWLALVKIGIRAKQRLLRDDAQERETGVVLEYGHTVGHALELETGTLTHGHAVGLGMLVAAAISRDRGWLTAAEEWRHAQALARVRAPVMLPRPVDVESVLARVRRDNKRGRIALGADQHAFVLLRHLGQVALTAGQPLVAVEEAEVRRAFAALSAGRYSSAGDAR